LMPPMAAHRMLRSRFAVAHTAHCFPKERKSSMGGFSIRLYCPY
jgi:hypothetical protein